MRAATPLSACGVALGEDSTGQIGERRDTLLEPIQGPFGGGGDNCSYRCGLLDVRGAIEVTPWLTDDRDPPAPRKDGPQG